MTQLRALNEELNKYFHVDLDLSIAEIDLELPSISEIFVNAKFLMLFYYHEAHVRYFSFRTSQRGSKKKSRTYR